MGKRKKTDNGLSPLQAEAKLLCDEATGHLKAANYTKALFVYNQALQLCPEDKTALVARSKCYLLLGQPRLALQDAETALEPDRNFVRAIFQKAEALYHLGDFEHSLMYYHRGLRLRPELAVFRLGVQKAQEAIENTIGTGIEESCQIMEAMERSKSGRAGGKGSMKPKLTSPGSGRRSSAPSPSGKPVPTPPSPSPVADGAAPGRAVSPAPSPVPGAAPAAAAVPAAQTKLATAPSINAPGSARSQSSRSSRGSSGVNRLQGNNLSNSGSADGEEQSARRLLGELCVDKLYLEQLLKHPDIRCARKDRNRTSQIAEHAEDGVEFLRNRQEFWRQQKLSTGPGGVSVSARRKTPTPTGTAGSAGSGGSARATPATPQAVS